jgi:PadR family transcriptional regulator, regulatory protein PadR
MTVDTLKVLQVFLGEPKDDHYGFEIAECAGVAAGSIYPILARLEKAKWLKSQWELIDPAIEGRRPRRYYKLTSTGLVEATNAIADAREFLFAGRPAWARS